MNSILGLDAHASVTPKVADHICVVIPAFNEELLIGRCIQSVIDAGVAPQHIFVVNDRSTDRTAEVASAFEGVNLVTNETNLGKLGGLRRAVAHFDLARRYEYLALLDADSHVAPDYFCEVLARFARGENVALVCGAPYSERYNWLTAYRALEYAVTLRAYRQGQDVMGVITVAPGCASTYATRILDSLDWDGGTLVEDMDLTIQIHRKKLGAVAFTPNAIAYTQDPRTPAEYIGQLTRWYSGTWQVMRLHRLPFGGQRVDLEVGLLTGEGLVYALMLVALPMLLWMKPAAVLYGLMFDQAIWFALAVAFAAQMRRADIVLSFPCFIFLRMTNCVLLLQTFWREIIRRQARREWFSVARYQVPGTKVRTADVAGR